MSDLNKKIRNMHGYENLKEILGEELGCAIYQIVGSAGDDDDFSLDEHRPEVVCPNLDCKAHHNKDACYACGWDNAILFCGPKVKKLENRLLDACNLIDRLYASGCLDQERNGRVQEWLKR